MFLVPKQELNKAAAADPAEPQDGTCLHLPALARACLLLAADLPELRFTPYRKGARKGKTRGGSQVEEEDY